ncbi:MAG: beta-N-acetylhexosaminidase [Clostridiales bacterium]|nr:beta-N-acetylhexosaminidase [Clostridiales bacterium]
MKNIQIIGAGTAEETGIRLTTEELGLTQAADGMPVRLIRLAGGAYTLQVEMQDGSARVEYRDIPALLRALRLLADALEREATVYTVQETRQLEKSGAMFDCSRNAVLTVDAVKYFLRQMAVMGLNTLLLYTEDTYEVEGEPYFGYLRGRYSIAQLREIDDYAAALGVEFIPCIQTLAHMEQFLKWNAATPYRDTDEVLMVGQEETYALLERMLRSVSSAVRTRRIHIGMDEAHTLGLGRHLDKYGYHTRFELMQAHIGRVKAITDSLGLQPMMWGDMVFRMYVDGGGYYDPDVQLPDEARHLVPEGIDLIYWDYYHQEEAFYHTYIGWHKKLGHLPVFGGGICTWTGAMVQNYNHTVKATEAAMRACKAEGVREAFACIWNDNGGECFYLSVLPGLVRYAEHMYHAAPDAAHMAERIQMFTGLEETAWASLCRLDCLDASLAPLEPQNPSKYLLWQDPLLGLFDRNAEPIPLEEHYATVRGELEARCGQPMPENCRGLFALVIRLCDVLGSKAKLGLRLKAAYDASDRARLDELAHTELPAVLEKVEALHAKHAQEWAAWNKPFGWEVLDLRYGGLEARLKTTAARVSAYLRGELGRIEELEPERLTFDGRERVEDLWMGHFNQYHLMVTPNNLG